MPEKELLRELGDETFIIISNTDQSKITPFIKLGQKIYHVSANYFAFKQKIYCSFSQMEGVGHRTWTVTKLVFFVAVINV